MLETFRGGILMLIRWFVQYPVVFVTYRLRNFTRAPFMLQPELQDKPGILVTNYGNYFFDDMIGGMFSPAWPFSFIDATCFRLPVARQTLDFCRSLPFVRAHDSRFSSEGRRELNEKSFARAAELLGQGHWFLVFPEVQPGHRAELLRPLKPGVAHIALRAEALANWKLGLRIYVYGTNYENKFVGRSHVYMRWATPIEVSRYREAFETNAAAAEQLLMNEIEKALHGVVLEAPTLQSLSDAHRLAHQRKQATFVGVQQALSEVIKGSASPEALRRIVCKRGESVLYQILGYAVFAIGFVLRWPFQAFGRLCAREPSQEMTYVFVLWMLVLGVGTAVNGSFYWARLQIINTWFAMTVWLWAWRRGIIER